MSSKPSLLFLVIIIMMGSVGLFATDIYLPALPQMAVYFNCSQSDIQTSFTVYLLGLAACQLVYGVLSDHFGRKRIILLGLTIFVSASILCAFAENLSDFLISRIFQAIGGGVGSVLARAIIADRYDRNEAAKIFSTTFPIIGLSVAIGPWIGGYLTAFFSWRAAFYFIGFYGLLTLLLVIFYLKESNTSRFQREEGSAFINTIAGYFGVIKNLQFLGYTFIVCAGFAALRSYTVESPFVFDNQGFSVEEMGSFYIALSVSYLLGNLMAKRLVNKLRIENILKIGFLFSLLGGSILVLGAFHIEISPYMIILPMSIITFGNGFIFPISSAGVMSSVSLPVAGLASGLMGALQFITAALCISWIGELCGGQAISMSLFIGTIILLGFFSFIFFIAPRAKVNIPVSE